MTKSVANKIVFIAVVSVLLLSTIAIGIQQSGTIVGTIEVPEDGQERPQKLTWAGDSLWYSNQNTETIYNVDPTSGEITNSFDTGLDSPYGIAANNSSIWVVSRDYTAETQTIYMYNATSGEEINKIPAPGARPGGIAYDGTNLWVASVDSGNRQNIYEISPDTGEVTNSIETDGISSRGGLAWGNGFLWANDRGTVTQIDPSTPSGEPVKEIDTPLDGLSLAWDGEYLWQSTISNYTIARVDPGDIGQTNAPPNASFEYSPEEPTAGAEISFDASISSDSNGFVETYSWDFDGDGISDSQGERTSYVYDSPGTYSVNLTVEDDNGVEGATTKVINVSAKGVQPSTVEKTVTNTPQPRNAATDEPAPTPTSGSGTNPPETVRTTTTSTDEVSTPLESVSTTSSDLTKFAPENDSSTETITPQKERGFLANGDGADPLGFLTDPFLVTVAGFIVSTFGILIQLLGGR